MPEHFGSVCPNKPVVLDARRPSPYLSPTMNRVLLTLLALLTGFAAQVSPAQAAVRGAGAAEVGAVQTVQAAVRLARQVVVAAGHASVGYDARLSEAAPLPCLVDGGSAVRIGIDRARQ